MITVIGVVDDLVDLPAGIKLLGQTVAAIIPVASGVTPETGEFTAVDPDTGEMEALDQTNDREELSPPRPPGQPARAPDRRGS